MSIKRFVFLAVVFCSAVLVFMTINRQCGLTPPEPELPKAPEAAAGRADSPKSVRDITFNNEESSIFLQGEDGEDQEIEDDAMTDKGFGAIIVPYTKRYLNIGQETKLFVFLENGEPGDEEQFSFIPELGKNAVSVEGIYNTAVVKALREGVQYVRVSHPLARESRIITFDVLPSGPPPPPSIELSESPLLLAKGETKPLTMTVMNGKASDNLKFDYKISENVYAVEVNQRGNILDITGIAPGAALIRISNGAVSRDYELMVVVDSYDFN